MQNALKSNKWRRILVLKIFKSEIQKRAPNDSTILQNMFSQEVRSSLFKLWKFEKPEKSTIESCRLHWNLIKSEEFGSLKFWIFKCRRGDQIIQPFCRIGFPLFNLWKFQVWDEYSWIMQNALKSYEWRGIWILKVFKIEIHIGEGGWGQIIQPFCRIGSPRSPSLIFRNFKSLRKVLMNHAECTEI